MNRAALFLLLVLLLCVPASAQNHENLVFVPVVRANIGERPLPQGGTEARGWYSRVFVRNFGTAASSARSVTFFSQGCLEADPLPAGAAVAVCSALRGPVDFVALELGPNVAVSGEMFRTSIRSGCAFKADVVNLGGASLPVFKGLFAAGDTTVTNHINVGGRTLTATCSSLPREAYRRRLNLTLANGGTEQATFTVRFFRLLSFGGGQVSEQRFVLEPREVKQFNAIQPDIGPLEAALDLDNAFVWASVVADQPYLGYLSSVFEDGGPDTMPLQIFPLRALN